LRIAFANALHMVAARGRLVLELDALNQMEDRDGAPDLVWLPPAIPANVRLVVSTLPGRPLDDLRKRGWPVLEVKPLDAGEREKLIVDYLAQYAKRLSLERLHGIAAARQSANGLYLTTLLNELRLFGSHEELNQRIDWYLEAAGPLELYRKVIERWEMDYGEPLPAGGNIVRESLMRLWAARRGLAETELLESLGTEGSPAPRALWSPLFLAAGDALVNRGGLLTFGHDSCGKPFRERTCPKLISSGAHTVPSLSTSAASRRVRANWTNCPGSGRKRGMGESGRPPCCAANLRGALATRRVRGESVLDADRKRKSTAHGAGLRGSDRATGPRAHPRVVDCETARRQGQTRGCPERQ